MPRKPKHPCNYPGCPNLTDGRYCSEHEKAESRNDYKYRRNKDVHKRYGRAWKRIRDKYVKTHPVCELCYQKGIIVPVDEVHHIVPLSEGGTHDPNNLISLCKNCHAKIHGARGDYQHHKIIYEYEK